MTTDEADDLAVRITRTWPSMRIPPDLWRDALAELDVGTCGTAYIRMRTTHQHPPSIADFIAVYRALPTAANTPARAHCIACGGDGFNTITQTVHGYTGEAFVPCSCPNGTAARKTLTEIRSRNDAELSRLFSGRTTRADTHQVQATDRLFEQPRADIA